LVLDLIGKRDTAENLAGNLQSEINRLHREIVELRAGKTVELFEIGTPAAGDSCEDFLVIWNPTLGTVDAKLAGKMALSIWARRVKVRVWATTLERMYRMLDSRFPPGRGYRYYTADLEENALELAS
jgi:hypothetical protein